MSADDLREMYVRLRDEMNARWHRDLPLDELIFDRWERARHLGFGEGSSIYHSSHVYGNVQVGEQTWIGPLTVLDGSGGLRIGSWCSISTGVQIYTHDSVAWSLSGGRADYSHAAVVIEDCCHIGPGAIIVKGVHVGAHSMIGANAVVTHDIDPYSIVYGVPAQRRGEVLISDQGEPELRFYKDESGGEHGGTP